VPAALGGILSRGEQVIRRLQCVDIKANGGRVGFDDSDA